MSIDWRIPATVTGLALTIAACASIPSDGESGNVYFVREGMVNEINPAITAIWDMQVEVMDDYGNFDPALMDDATWQRLVVAALTLQSEARAMSNAGQYVVVDPAGSLTEEPEGTVFAEIQQRLDAKEDQYRALSAAFAQQTTDLVTAAQARNAEDVTELVNAMQPVCGSCHEVFWFPES